MTNTEINDQLEVDFSKLELRRGQTHEDIKEKCFKLCKQYLSGVWKEVGIEEVEVRRINGGLTNQLFYCGINEDKRISEVDVPQEVAIRLYEKKHFNNYENQTNERLNDTIISIMVSENGIGPKVYGIFEAGQIQGYYKHKQFRLEEQANPKLVNELAMKLARIHAMEVPIKKTGNWMFESWDGLYSQAQEIFDLSSIYKKCNLSTFLTKDIKQEMDWLKKTVLEVDSPITFTHIDFRGPNIMITDSNAIVLCDFEYSSYGFRGVDIGSIFAEWDQTTMWGMCVHFAEDITLLPFIDTYIEESVKLRGKEFSEDPRNSVQHILREGKVFALASMFLMTLILIKHNESISEGMPFDKEKQMIFAEEYYKNYHRLKQRFIDTKVCNL